MDIPILGQNAQIPVNESNARKVEKEGKKSSGMDVDASIKSQILSSHVNVNLSIKDNDLMLVYKNAITELNDILAPFLGEESGGLQAVDPEEYTPEATAGRIVQFATAFFESYKTQNPSLSEEEALNKYMDIIGGAIEKGFGEAVDILKGLNVFEGNVEENATKTLELINQGLEAFRDSFGYNKEEGDDAATVSA